MRVVLITGGFDPIHSGHISYIEESRRLGDILVVGINSDRWLERKKGTYFLEFSERKRILESIRGVDLVIGFNDDDDSARDAIEEIRRRYIGDEIIFCNGGDRDARNIPEMDREGVEFIFGVGGEDKKNSSSWILKRWIDRIQEREWRGWGEFRVLGRGEGWKLKEMVVEVGERLSLQRHFRRGEEWMVVEGRGLEEGSGRILEKFDKITIDVGQWHRLENIGEDRLRVIEIQYGEECIEEDIERVQER